jgi:phosphatidate cytidylyltransferase
MYLQNILVFSLMISLISFLAMYEWIKNDFTSRYFSGFGLIFLFWFCSIYFVMNYSTPLIYQTLFASLGSLSIYNIFLIIILNTAIFDTFAYVVGSNFGKNFITPKISPNKTLEGLLGGLIGNTFFSLIICYFYSISYLLILIFIIGGILAFIGDLKISFHKRQSGIKDTGSLLPGHGGILDRLDSHLIATPVILILTIKLLPLL